MLVIGVNTRCCGLIGVTGIQRIAVDPKSIVLRAIHLHGLILHLYTITNTQLFFTLGSIDNSSSRLNTPALHQARVENSVCAALMAPIVAGLVQEAFIEALEGVSEVVQW
jgi:hypothetical protein